MIDERLERIKDRYMKQEYDYALSSMDIDWLIDQAESYEKIKKEFAEDMDFKRKEVKELEKSVSGWVKQYDKLVRELEDLKADYNNQLFDIANSSSDSQNIKRVLNKIWNDSIELSNVDHERGEEYISLVELRDIILEVEPE